MYIPVDINSAVAKECKRRRYSIQTAESYLYWINRFLKQNKKELGKISKKEVREFLEGLDDKNLAGNTMNVAHMAIKFLFEDVMRRKIWIDIKYSKVPRRIQRVLSKEEINILIKAIANNQHRLIIALMYSAGLRVSEVVNLKIKDLEIERGYGFVRGGKGGKDRLFIISKRLEIALEQKCLNRGKEEYLFLTNRKNKYSIRSLQQIIKKAAKKSEISDWKEIHCHTLRHSFATHLIEQGQSVAEVQSLLGHKSPETSMSYIHKSGQMIKIKSPFDFNLNGTTNKKY